MHLNFRPYRSSDYHQVWQLHRQALEHTGAFLSGHGKWNDDLKNIERNYVASGGEFIVVENENRIIAMGALRPISPATAEIKRMRVHPEYQRHGIGQKILDMLEATAKRGGFTEIVLDTTNLQTAAQRFYEKNGYSETHRQKKDKFELIFYSKSLW